MNQNIEKILLEKNFKLIKSNNLFFKSKIVFDSRTNKISPKKKSSISTFLWSRNII